MFDLCKENIERVKSILPPERDLTDFNYTDEEIDRIKAYVLLCHAELEYYFEKSILKIIENSFNNWDNQGSINEVIAGVVNCFHPFHEDAKDKIGVKKTADLRTTAFKAKSIIIKKIDNNHGVKKDNLLPLMMAINFDTTTNGILFEKLETLGANRGLYAHDPTRRSHVSPSSAISEIEEILMLIAPFEQYKGRFL